MDFPKAFHEVK